jgi:hypothetical protein
LVPKKLFLEVNRITINDYLNQNNSEYSIMLSQIKIINMVKLIEEKNLEMEFLSDGGLKSNIGGSGVVASIASITVLETQFKLPKIYEEYTLHRCKALGLLNSVMLFEKLQYFRKTYKTTKLFKTNAIFYCDNKAVTKTVNKHKQHGTNTKDFCKPSFDVIAKIIRTWTKISKQFVNIQVIHIKGHQDKQTTILSHPAVLNVRADVLATNAINQKIMSGQLPIFYYSIIYKWINCNIKIQKILETELFVNGHT